MPIHVHVKKGGNESTFELIMQDKILVEIRERTSNLHTPLTPAETKMALEFIQKYSQNIINKWINCFVWNKPVRSTKITKKNIIMKIFITKAVCNDDLTVQLRFNDNTEKTVDIGNFIRKNPHPQYEKYLQPKNFKKAKLESGNIVWGKNWDLIFPIEDLYIGCIR